MVQTYFPTKNDWWQGQINFTEESVVRVILAHNLQHLGLAVGHLGISNPEVFSVQEIGFSVRKGGKSRDFNERKS